MRSKHLLMTLALATAWLTAAGQTVTTNTGDTYEASDLRVGILKEATSLTVSGTWTAEQVRTLRSTIAGMTTLKTVTFSTDAMMMSMEYLFQDCTALESVTMPTVTNSTPVNFFRAFRNCRALKRVDLSAFTAISHMWGAFWGCSALEGVTMPAMNISPASGVSFRETFSGCKALREMVDLRAFTAISSMEAAFDSCAMLKGVTMPTTNTLPAAEVSFNHAFYGCKTLKTIDLSVFTKISDMGCAFQNCTTLSGVTMPTVENSDLSFDRAVSFDRAFCDCKALKRVDLSTFTNIANMNLAFFRCTGLTEVKMPTTENTLSIDFNQAFEGCTALKGIIDLSGFIAIRNMTSAFWNCSSLTGVKLGGTQPTYIYYANNAFGDANPNCLVYVPTGWTRPLGYGWKNITYIIGGMTDGDVTLQVDKPFHCPEAFTIKAGSRITYTRDFGKKPSGIDGTAAGWETISLPFTPTEITGTNAAGNPITLAPFNTDGTYEGKGTDGIVPFWLRSLTADKYSPAAMIEPNKPYIIAMPNNEKYDAKFNVTGKVTFSAVSTEASPVTIGVTPEVMPSVVGNQYTLHGNYATVPAAPSVYVINEAGTAFVANGGDALPFRPYVMANSAQNAPAHFVIGKDEGGATAIEEALLMGQSGSNGADSFRVYGAAKPGSLVVEVSTSASTVDVVAVDGRTVRTVSLHEGVNVVDGLTAGVYVVGGCKAVVR